jgi:hypothetical protein
LFNVFSPISPGMYLVVLSLLQVLALPAAMVEKVKAVFESKKLLPDPIELFGQVFSVVSCRFVDTCNTFASTGRYFSLMCNGRVRAVTMRPHDHPDNVNGNAKRKMTQSKERKMTTSQHTDLLAKEMKALGIELPLPPSAIEEEHPDLVVQKQKASKLGKMFRRKSKHSSLQTPAGFTDATSSLPGSPALSRNGSRSGSPAMSRKGSRTQGGSPFEMGEFDPLDAAALGAKLSRLVGSGGDNNGASAAITIPSTPTASRSNSGNSPLSPLSGGGNLAGSAPLIHVLPSTPESDGISEDKKRRVRSTSSISEGSDVGGRVVSLEGVKAQIRGMEERRKGSKVYTVFVIRVTQPHNDDEEARPYPAFDTSWVVLRRYSEFASLEKKCAFCEKNGICWVARESYQNLTRLLA